MNASDKWLDQLNPSASLCDAARVAIPRRLQAVRWHLPRAMSQHHAAVEHVHQLRVATRRCQAALSLFQEVLPKEPRAALKSQLQQLRRAAGPVRDIDVFLLRVQEVGDEAGLTENETGELSRKLAADRRRTREEMNEVLHLFLEPKIRVGWLQFPGRIHAAAGRREPLWRETCLRRLKKLNKRFREAAIAIPEDISSASADFTQLHQFRITGKKLRYTLELSAGALPDVFRSPYRRIVELQEHLGDVNDLINACDFLDHCQQRKPFRSVKRTLDKLREHHQQLLQLSLANWQHWWNDEHQQALWSSLQEVIGGKHGSQKKGA